jgi:hypothetical protein
MEAPAPYNPKKKRFRAELAKNAKENQPVVWLMPFNLLVCAFVSVSI